MKAGGWRGKSCDSRPNLPGGTVGQGSPGVAGVSDQRNAGSMSCPAAMCHPRGAGRDTFPTRRAAMRGSALNEAQNQQHRPQGLMHTHARTEAHHISGAVKCQLWPFYNLETTASETETEHRHVAAGDVTSACVLPLPLARPTLPVPSGPAAPCLAGRSSV